MEHVLIVIGGIAAGWLMRSSEIGHLRKGVDHLEKQVASLVAEMPDTIEKLTRAARWSPEIEASEADPVFEGRFAWRDDDVESEIEAEELEDRIEMDMFRRQIEDRLHLQQQEDNEAAEILRRRNHS